MAPFPLLSELNNTKYGYKSFNTEISHLFYMDILKLFLREDEVLVDFLTTTKEFRMVFGFGKCAKATFIRCEFKQSVFVKLRDLKILNTRGKTKEMVYITLLWKNK